MSDRPTRTGVNALKPEIEVTPEMIRAGKLALWPSEVLPYLDSGDVVTKIYRAMEKARFVSTQKGE
jgi:hypothetical protein